MARLRTARVLGVVDFTQAASRGFEELRRAIHADETGALLGIDTVVQYPAWPRAWPAKADWLRFRDKGGCRRAVISHFLFLAGRFLGPLSLRLAALRYPAGPGGDRLCELDLIARLETADGRPVAILATTGGRQPDRQEVTLRGTRLNHRFRGFNPLWRPDGGPWVEAVDWSTGEGPRRSALQRQLTQADRWLRGQPRLLATAEEALAVQELVEGMLAAG